MMTMHFDISRNESRTEWPVDSMIRLDVEWKSDNDKHRRGLYAMSIDNSTPQ
jgi:hypothetical protein